MLMGEFEHTLDAKGRISMPAKLRKDMGDAFILTKGLDGCLFAFSSEEWLNFETKLKKISSINLKGNKKIQHFSQVKNNQSEYINKKLNDNLLEFNDIEQIIKNKKEDTPNEELEELDIDVNQLMEKINKEFSDIGKLIRVNFIVNNENEKENKYIYDKNEHVLLKIIANDLNENQGINAKEFFYKYTI